MIMIPKMSIVYTKQYHIPIIEVVTDGESTALGRYKLPNTAQLLKEMGVTIIAIGIGKGSTHVVRTSFVSN